VQVAAQLRASLAAASADADRRQREEQAVRADREHMATLLARYRAEAEDHSRAIQSARTRLREMNAAYDERIAVLQSEAAGRRQRQQQQPPVLLPGEKRPLGAGGPGKRQLREALAAAQAHAATLAQQVTDHHGRQTAFLKRATGLVRAVVAAEQRAAVIEAAQALMALLRYAHLDVSVGRH
jgi:hypothetical protein